MWSWNYFRDKHSGPSSEVVFVYDEDVEVYEQTKITARQGKRLDIESAYIDAGQVIEDDKPCEKRYIHVFSEAGFPEITKPDILEIRKYKEDYLVLSYQRKLEGSRHSWEIIIEYML